MATLPHTHTSVTSDSVGIRTTVVATAGQVLTAMATSNSVSGITETLFIPVTPTEGGGGSVGTFATVTALQTAFPAASNGGSSALVGSSAPYLPYISNGTGWVQQVQVVGIFATTSALQTAYPAASNVGELALVGASAPYFAYYSDGTNWTQLAPYNAPVSLGAATNLTAAADGNRQVVFSGANATLTILNDTSGGWTNDAQVIVQTSAGSAGLPTLATPDSKTITAPNVNTPIGATRKGANSWDVFLLPQSTGGGSTLSTFGPGTQFGAVIPCVNFTTVDHFGVMTPNSVGTVQFRAAGTSTYTQMARVGYLGTAGANHTVAYYTNLLFTLGGARQRVVINASPHDTMGNTAAFFMGWSSSLSAFTTTTLDPNNDFLGAKIGIGWGSTAGQTNIQLVTSPSSGTGNFADLGSSFPIPTTAELNMYQLQLDYYPTSDPGGRRVVYLVTNLISGATATGTITTNLIAQTTAQQYSVGVNRYTVATSGTPDVDFAGIYFGATTQWAP